MRAFVPMEDAQASFPILRLFVAFRLSHLLHTVPPSNTCQAAADYGDGNEYGNGDGNEYGIGEGGRVAKRRKNRHKSCRSDVRNGGDLVGKRKKRRQERVGSVAVDPDNLDNVKEAGREAQDTRG